MQMLESDGKARPLLSKPDDYDRPSFSRDGQRLAIEVRDGADQGIWVYDLGRGAPTRITFDGKSNQMPIRIPCVYYHRCTCYKLITSRIAALPLC